MRKAFGDKLLIDGLHLSVPAGEAGCKGTWYGLMSDGVACSIQMLVLDSKQVYGWCDCSC